MKDENPGSVSIDTPLYINTVHSICTSNNFNAHIETFFYIFFTFYNFQLIIKAILVIDNVVIVMINISIVFINNSITI